MESAYYSYNQFVIDLPIVLEQIDEAGRFTDIIALTRGGLVPAVAISHSFNIPLQACVPADVPKAFDTVCSRNPNARVLVVDDIFDSGDTITTIIQSIASSEKYTTSDLEDRLHFACMLINTDAADKLPLEPYLPNCSVHYARPFSRRLVKHWFTFFWEQPQYQR